MAKATETRILQSLALGNNLTVNQIDQLFAKIDKGQSKKRARHITADSELRYASAIALMTPPEVQVVQRGITDYSNSSAVINTSCRNGAPTAAALNIDQMFIIYANLGLHNIPRVTYRLMSYALGANIPYGALGGIAVNDHITDAAFVSASENRQLLISGINNPTPGTRYVKFSIVGQGGINISGGSLYNNANEKAMCKQLYPKTWRARTPNAGQAEILFNRGKIFHVDKISTVNNDIHVVLSIPPLPHGGVITKNSYTGL